MEAAMSEDSTVGRRIVGRWSEFKLTSPNFYRLRGPFTQKTDFRAPQMGHPSTYACVEFHCVPGHDLVFAAGPVWPASLSAQYCARLEEAIGYGIADVLMAEHFYPYRGCVVTLVAVGWDDVSSSEVSFYKATKLAMKQLIEKGDWTFSYEEHAGSPAGGPPPGGPR
jgi:hypothetical protein